MEITEQSFNDSKVSCRYITSIICRMLVFRVRHAGSLKKCLLERSTAGGRAYLWVFIKIAQCELNKTNTKAVGANFLETIL